MNDTYKSIAAPSEGLFKDSGSRFCSFAFPVENEDEIKPILDSLKKTHHAARHHCYAYRIGLEGRIFRANDDGEPSSSAGRPILGQIDSSGLSDILIVVVRYFGGIKLGIPGLIRAYRTAASEAVSAASIIEKVAMKRLHLSFTYGQMNNVMRIIKDYGLTFRNQDFGQICNIDIGVRLSVAAEVEALFADMPDTEITSRDASKTSPSDA